MPRVMPAARERRGRKVPGVLGPGENFYFSPPVMCSGIVSCKERNKCLFRGILSSRLESDENIPRNRRSQKSEMFPNLRSFAINQAGQLNLAHCVPDRDR